MSSPFAPTTPVNTPTKDSLFPYRHYPHHTPYATFLNGCTTKVTFAEVIEQGPESALKLKRSIFAILKNLAQAPIDEVELLLILLALHDTQDVVRVKWRRTERGQQVKAVWVEAREAAVRAGIVRGEED